jgi:large repetitive protein
VVTDGDQDPSAAATANIGGALAFLDDGPSLQAVAPPAASLEVDESDLAFNATADLSTLFTPTFGADGAGLVTNYTLSSGTNAASGLTDTETNEADVLNKVGNDIVGTAGIGGPIVFVVRFVSSSADARPRSPSISSGRCFMPMCLTRMMRRGCSRLI